MKIAYLTLCHKNPEQVEMMIDTLNSENTDFYVHIDKKAQDFNIRKLNNVFVLPEGYRVDIRWGANSMIVATLNLTHFMFEQNIRYDYVFLLSGQDFPIKGNDEILKFLKDNYNANFIEVLEHSDKMYKIYKKRTELFYPEWIFTQSAVAKILKKLYICFSGGCNHTFRIFKRKNTLGISFEFGSQWWALTYDCLSWITNYIDTHEDILKFMNNALVPDECVFQTVFMASPYKNTQKDKLTYLEWSENKNNPRLLTSQDYEILKSSSCLFARKFDILIDEEILKKLKNISL